MNFEGLIADHVRDIPSSPIRKFFDVVNEMDGAISLGLGRRFCYAMAYRERLFNLYRTVKQHIPLMPARWSFASRFLLI